MRKFAWLLIAVVVVVAAWTTGWFWAAGEVTGQVRLLAQADGEATPKFECGSFGVSGFPFRFDLDCENGTLTDQDLTVNFTGLRASVMAYNPTHMIFSAKGPFSYDDAFSGSQRRLDFSRLDGSLRVVPADLLKGLGGEGWRLARLSVETDDIAVTDTVAGDILEASAKHLEAHLVDMPDQFDKAAGTSALASYVAAAELSLPGLQVASGNLTLESQITGLPADIRDFGNPDAIRNWQAAGGSVKLVKLAGTQPSPAESFDVSGEARLSGGGYVEGQVDYSTTGVLDRLSQFLPPVQLAMLKGAPQADGSFRNTVTILDGQMKILTFVFAQLPPLF
ncbi:MAG: DUF2125 domain-containing protein [Devosia sp.]|uniref:DUF2125 domain-containing protein n=1 Tax=Devosia sp. TaxID=1871048 RepID=UPI001AC055D6|nr:DUF2125 domain-containing protein [Devosia sp.]MBN9311130.1 DUF2125 domain-containing protein [Devosia sp.]MBN9315153.1 DUF2125 domain-containing protein [Devosia sp.]